jgi:hypothetical protein
LGFFALSEAEPLGETGGNRALGPPQLNQGVSNGCKSLLLCLGGGIMTLGFITVEFGGKRQHLVFSLCLRLSLWVKQGEIGHWGLPN